MVTLVFPRTVSNGRLGAIARFNGPRAEPKMTKYEPWAMPEPAAPSGILLAAFMMPSGPVRMRGAADTAVAKIKLNQCLFIAPPDGSCGLG